MQFPLSLAHSQQSGMRKTPAYLPQQPRPQRQAHALTTKRAHPKKASQHQLPQRRREEVNIFIYLCILLAYTHSPISMAARQLVLIEHEAENEEEVEGVEQDMHDGAL